VNEGSAADETIGITQQEITTATASTRLNNLFVIFIFLSPHNKNFI
jgi:hypothetical protein